MTDWIRDNKFLACLIGAMMGLLGVLGFLKYVQVSEFEEHSKKISQLSNKIKGFRTKLGDPNPNAKNKLGLDVAEGLNEALDLFNKLAKPGIAVLNSNKSPTDFSSLTTKYIKSVKQTLKGGKVTFNKDSWFGFEKYSEALIIDNKMAIELCLYQQKAYSWLFNELAKLESCSLISFYREPMMEEFQDDTVEPKVFKAARNFRTDLVLKMSEEQLAKLLDVLANSDQFLFSVRDIALKNEQLLPMAIPSIMKKESAKKKKDGFFDNNFFDGNEEDDAVEEEATVGRKLRGQIKPGEKKVVQVLGEEKLSVAIAMDLVIITSLDKLNLKKGGQGK